MSEYSDYVDKPVIAPRQPLTSKRAVEFLLEGTLKVKVCKYCLNVTSALTDLDQYLKVTGEAGFYKVTIKDMVACFYPYQVTADSNLPDKVCEECLDHIISSYLFTQQCERADRALRNCFAEINEKLEKLDPLVRPITRGRRKANPNTNKIIISHRRVIDYADPLMSLVSQGTDMEKSDDIKVNELECPKCWQEFNNIAALVNHKKSHPNTMWFYCKFCGLSFAKENFYRKHLNTAHAYQMSTVNKSPLPNSFKCNECGITSENYSTQLQHVEKHKFKGVMEAVLDKKLDQVCSICFEKGRKMVEMDSTVHFHGGYPGLSGRQNLYNVMDSSLPTRKSRYKYRELLLSNTAKVLRMKRKSEMIEDTLNSTKLESDNSHRDRRTSNFTYTQAKEDEKESQVDSNIVDNESAKTIVDDETEFTFSMPLIIPAKRRKLDLDAIELTIKSKQNKSIHMENGTKNNECEDKREGTNKNSFNEPSEALDKVTDEIDQTQIESSEQEKNEILKKSDGDCENASENVNALSFNSVYKDNIHNEDNNKNITEGIKSCTSSYPNNVTKSPTEIVSNISCSHEWSFSKASIIIRNISPSLFKIVEEELSRDSGTVGVEFTFPNPFKCTDNGKKYLRHKSLTDGNTKIEKNIDVKEKTHFDAAKNEGDCIKEKTEFSLSKDAEMLVSNTQNSKENLKIQSNAIKEQIRNLAHKDVLKSVTENDGDDKVDSEIQTKINETDDCKKIMYPAILRDCIKLPDSKIENNKKDVDMKNDQIKSHEQISSSSVTKPASTVDEVKKDICKQTDLIDGSCSAISDTLKNIIRKRKHINVLSVETKQSWECIYCFTNNEPHRVSCFCCGSVKDANKFNITINFGTMKKRRFEENKPESSPKENEIKNEQSTLSDNNREAGKSTINVSSSQTDIFTKVVQPITTSLAIVTTSTIPISSTVTTPLTISAPKVIPSTVITPSAITISTITTPSTTTALTTTIPLPTITTSVSNFTVPSCTSESKTETLKTNPINPIPFNPTTTPLFQFGKTNTTKEIKEEKPIDSSAVPKLILQPLDKGLQDKTLVPHLTLPNNLETGLNTDKSIKKAVKFDDAIKTFNFSDTSNKGIFQFGKPEPKKDAISVPQIQTEQKFGALPSITELPKPQITHNVLEDIDMTEVADTSANNFNTSITSLPQQPTIISSLFQTPSTLPKTFGTEQKDTPNAFKPFGNFSTPLSALPENKPAFEAPVIQSPFTFGNNLNFSIGAAPPDNKGNANAARKTEMRKMRTARRRCN
ncbi:hypothetical protein EVAR_61480_1 [Eumeta japonica]|uniref:Uncharacterized protein n=1 Tax=Eumeta variegata TaxID=151549 RepID=A0A4C1ZHY2_EUMVA|nr:hypothetical protein EVAR_61480_1 [Eumeta japonica]